MGFLFRGYILRYYYWETVIMFRKIALILIQSFLVQFGVLLQALVVFVLLILFLVLTMTLSPFQTVVLNRLEILHPGNIFLLNKASYELLTANGFITAHVTLKGKSNIGSCYSAIDAFNSRVLNFNSSKKFVR